MLCYRNVQPMHDTHPPSEFHNEPIATWPIDGTLDLHAFKPGEVGDLVPEYLAECGRRGIRQVRIIHGKGTGQLRERVHAVLRRIPAVASFSLAPGAMGGWGATVVELRP